jgi:hypothetical protein
MKTPTTGLPEVADTGKRVAGLKGTQSALFDSFPVNYYFMLIPARGKNWP